MVEAIYPAVKGGRDPALCPNYNDALGQYDGLHQPADGVVPYNEILR